MSNSLLDAKPQLHFQGQVNIQFLSIDIGLKNSGSDYSPRIQSWSIMDDDVFEESLSVEIENKLNKIDSGNEKLNRYSSVDDYLKHLDQVLEE